MTASHYEHTHAFLSALAGIDTVYDFRAYHDQRRDLPSRVMRGTFAACERAMQAAQADGFGIHVVMNETDGVGLKRANIRTCRAQLLDLDGVDAAQRMAQVLAGPVAPHMIVRTSHGKAQLWFKVTPHDDLGLHEDNQVRLLRAYGGDDQVVGAERTARLPGFYHLKAEPSLVTVEAGPLWTGGVHDARGIAGALWNISVERAVHADRQALGHGPWQAPNREMLERALDRIDPNSLTWQEWIAVTAATKQAGWSLGPDVARSIWDGWCARYAGNDPGENGKQWRHIGDATSSGWAKLERESGLVGERMFAAVPAVVDGSVGGVPLPTTISEEPEITSCQQAIDRWRGSEMLFPAEQISYFTGCFWISSLGRILTPDNILMDQNKFKGTYGGKKFAVDQGGKAIGDPWKAALEGSVPVIQKVTHLRFLPTLPFGHVEKDEFGRPGVNTYRPPAVVPVSGDVTLFTRHCENLFPNAQDRDVLYAFLAQCVQRPGVKVGWSVLIQSVEGAGKTIFKTVMEAALGLSYVYGPNARELAESGGKFNGWLRNRLMIICDEIRTDEKRVLTEVLKPLITEKRVEIQNKGVDQDMGDNPTNWLMFSNHKDAVPINKDSRRVAVIYSAAQENEDLVKLGMTGSYFPQLYDWVDNLGGASAVAHWLLHYPIPAHLDAKQGCTRAPQTSSTAEAIVESRGWLEMLIADAVAADRPGFRNGWISAGMVGKLIAEEKIKPVSSKAMSAAIRSLGYHQIGQAKRIYVQEFLGRQPKLYNVNPSALLDDYGRAQGYESNTSTGSVPIPMLYAAQ